MNWIDIDTRKPERWQYCIVATADGVSPKSMMVWDGKKWFIQMSDDEYGFPVKWWMLWPEGPAEGNGKK
jgi:hypothetical protein